MRKTVRWEKTINFRIRYVAILCTILLTIGMTQSANAGTFTVTNNADSGNGSLRMAITDANGLPGPHTINFTGFFGTITPSSPLPAITSNSVTIDGYTATGASPNANPNGGIGNPFNGTLTVELDGSSAGNSGIGLRISASNCTVRGLVINRFKNAGIRIDAGTANSIVGNNNIFGNFIGTDTDGTAALGNVNFGILIVGSTGNNIGDSSDLSTRNVISGNSGNGIGISGGGSATIRRNLIGTDKTGAVDLGNSLDGILIADSSGSAVGTSTSSRNVISGNNGNGVAIIQSDSTTAASGNSVAGNYIGVDIGGNTALRNNGSGVSIQAAGNTIGGNAATAGNVISGNSVNGIAITSSLGTDTIIIKNLIGVGANGTTAVGNFQSGIRIANFAKNNTVGGTNSSLGVCGGVCNLIANNGNINAIEARAGIYVTSTGGSSNAIRGNSLFNNLGIGIDLAVVGAMNGGVGSTPNDVGDPDTGANNIQNYPVVASADTNGSINGMLNSTANTLFEIDFYRNPAAGDEGQFFIGTTSVFTNGSGDATFSFGATTPVTAGQNITATATSTGGAAQAIGDTSEFSATQTVIPATGSGGAGLEADLIDRPSGDGIIDASDVQEIRRLVAGLDRPFQSNEFQRADCSPAGTRGDGVLNASDITQARRYVAGLDTKQSAGGPTGPPAQAKSQVEKFVSVAANKPESPQVGRAVRVISQSGMPNQAITVPINVDTQGDEASYSFSISFDNTKLTANSVTIGNLGGNVLPNIDNANGTIGFSVDFNGGTVAQVTNQTLVNVNFTVNNGATAGATPVNFTDNPTSRNVSGTNPNIPLPQPTYENGVVNINAPSANGRAVRIINQNSSAGQMVTVPINVDTQGDEASYSFSISFDNTKLTANSVTIGNLGGNVLPNIDNANGTIGFSVDFNGGTVAQVTNQTLVNVNFTVNNGATAGATPVNFTDNPTSRNVSGTNPNIPLPQPTYENGVVNIAAPSAAGVSIGGQVLGRGNNPISKAVITLTDDAGNSRTTYSTSFGFYRFDDVAAGRTYTISVKVRRYNFTPRVFSVSDNLTNLNLYADQ